MATTASGHACGLFIQALEPQMPSNNAGTYTSASRRGSASPTLPARFQSCSGPLCSRLKALDQLRKHGERHTAVERDLKLPDGRAIVRGDGARTDTLPGLSSGVDRLFGHCHDAFSCRTKDGDLRRIWPPPRNALKPHGWLSRIVRPSGTRRGRRTAARRALRPRNRVVLRDLRGRSRTNLASKSGDELPRIRDVGRVFRFTLER